jgi:hypothetical protein
VAYPQQASGLLAFRRQGAGLLAFPRQGAGQALRKVQVSRVLEHPVIWAAADDEGAEL